MQAADRGHRQAAAVADPERVGAEVGFDEQRVVLVLGARRPQRRLRVHRLLHVLRQQAEDVRGALRPVLEPPAPVGEGGVDEVFPRGVGEVGGDGEPRPCQRGPGIVHGPSMPAAARALLLVQAPPRRLRLLRHSGAMDLAPGQNVPLTGTSVAASVTGPLDLTALVLSGDGTVDGDGDMVFFNQPAAPGVVLSGRELTLDLGQLRPGAERVALVASPAEEGTAFGAVGPVALVVRHGGEELVFRPTGLGPETALVLCEVYLRGDAWKLRAVGQGYASGLAGVAVDFGIEVDDEPTAAPPAAPVAPPPVPVPAPAAPAIDLQKRPLGTISLAKSGAALIPLTKGDRGTLRLRASLRWKGRRTGASDLDLYALYIDDDLVEKAVYYEQKGSWTGPPFLQLDGDSRGAGEENLTIVAGHHRYVLLCAYSALGNGIGAFASYQAHVVVDDGQGSEVTVPLFNKNKFSYWVAIALLDLTDPAGARVAQVEQYGKNFSEKRPLLHPDGRFEMSKGPVEFKGR